MRFLVDECLPVRLPRASTDHGHDEVHVSERDLLGAPDEAVMASAVGEDRVLVSADTDFGELLAIGKATVPSVVLFRGSATPQRPVLMLIDNLVQIEEELDAGAVVVLGSGRIRIRRLPLA